MIFEQPEFQIAGDRALLMVLGDEMSFDLNFKVHSLARIIRESNTRGIIELIPEMASLLVSYDPELDCIRRSGYRAQCNAAGDQPFRCG